MTRKSILKLIFLKSTSMKKSDYNVKMFDEFVESRD